jgi:hypothetical protein
MYTGNKFIPQVVPERFSKVTRDEILNHILEYGPNPSVIFK